MAENIRSVEQLEILCLLVEERTKFWSVADTFRHIRSAEKSVAEGLQHFVTQGLSATDPQGAFRFAPKTRELDDLVLELVKTYRERPVAVIETIYRKPMESVQHFAEGFRLRREK
jgi:hypothetical protein